MADQLYIDNNVGVEALRLYVKNDNLDVGAVTVRHQIFPELITQIRAGKGLDDAKAVFGFCFNNRNIFGKGKEVYESPLAGEYYTDSDGIQRVRVSPRLADLILEEIKAMELTEDNIVAACYDLIDCGRMWQELTIDATKTMYNVVIPYANDMVHVKLNSREQTENEFNIICDWKINSIDDEEEQRRAIISQKRSWIQQGTNWRKYKNVNYILNKNASVTLREKRNGQTIAIRHVADFLHEVRLSIATQGLEFAADMMDLKQKMPVKVLAEIMQEMRRPEMKEAQEIAMFFHQAFRTVQSYKTKNIMDIMTTYPKNSNAAKERIDGIKRDVQKVTRAISNQLRSEYKKMGLSQKDMIVVLMNTVIAADNNAAFGHMILDIEFFNWVMNSFKDDPALKHKTRDILINCDIPAGTEVEFVLGHAEDEDGNEADCDVALDGLFTITEEDGVFYAEQEITLEEPEVDDDSILFITKPGGGKDSYTCSHLSEISKAMMCKEITLVPFADNDVHDAIVLNDTVIGSFRCSFAIAGQPITPVRLTELYKNKKGIVDHIITSKQDGVIGEVAVVIMKNIKTVSTPVINKNLVAEYSKEEAMKRVQESKKKAPMFSMKFSFDAPAVEKKPVENVVIVPPEDKERIILTPAQFVGKLLS